MAGAGLSSAGTGRQAVGSRTRAAGDIPLRGTEGPDYSVRRDVARRSEAIRRRHCEISSGGQTGRARVTAG